MSDLRTFRSWGVSIIAWASVAILVTLLVVIGRAVPESMKFSTSGTVTMWLLIVAWAVFAYGISRSKVTADAEKIQIVNGFRKHELAWSEVAGISLNSGGPWPILVTKDDRRIMLFGVQASEGESSRRALAWLRGHVA